MSEEGVMVEVGGRMVPLYGREILLEYDLGDVDGVYATHATVQHTQHEFVMCFYEAKAPPIVGGVEARRQTLDELQSVRADCVARVIVSAARFPGFVDAMRINLDNYRRRFSGIEEEE